MTGGRRDDGCRCVALAVLVGPDGEVGWQLGRVVVVALLQTRTEEWEARVTAFLTASLQDPTR
jgi:hypothetical protein